MWEVMSAWADSLELKDALERGWEPFGVTTNRAANSYYPNYSWDQDVVHLRRMREIRINLSDQRDPTGPA